MLYLGMEVGISITLFFIALIVRWLPVRNTNIDPDSYYYALSIAEVKRQKIGFFGSLKFDMVPYGVWEAPYMWQWLFSFLPFSIIRNNINLINVALDALFAVLIYGIFRYLGFGFELALYAFLLYLFTPMWFSSLFPGPRIYSLTPRLFSEVVCNLLLVFLVIPLPVSPIITYSLAIVLMLVLILSSKFGNQVVLFVLPIISIMMLDPMIIVVLIVSYLLALLLTRGQYLESFKEQYLHLRNYYLKNRDGEMPISNRNSISRLKSTISSEKGLIENFTSFLNYILKWNSYTAVLFKLPALPLVLILITYFYISTGQPVVSDYWITPVVAAFLIYLIINIPIFLFLGESERYLNHVALFIVGSLLSIVIYMQLQWLIWLLVGYGIFYWIVEIYMVSNSKKFNNNKQVLDQRIISFLQSLKQKKVVLCYPYQAVGIWRILLDTHHSVLYPPPFKNKSLSESFSVYLDNYPFINLEKLDEMSSVFGVDMVIAHRDKLNQNQLKNWRPSELWIKAPISNELYDVYLKRSSDHESDPK